MQTPSDLSSASQGAAAPGLRQPRSIALGLIFTIMLLDVTGITILIPVSVYIVREYSSAALMVILLNVIYAAAQFLAAPALGKLSDRFGRRPVLLICLLGAALGYALFGIAGALWLLFLSRLLAGITGGSLSTASAYIVDVSKPANLAKNMSLVGLAWGVGLVIGPAMGGFFGQIDLRAPAFIAAGLCVLNLILGLIWLPESLPKERREIKPIRVSDFNTFLSIRKISQVPGLAILLLVLCLFNFAMNGIYSTESLYLIYRFNIQPWQIGLLQGLNGIAIALVQASVPFLVSRFGEKAIAIAGLLIQAAGSLAVSINPIFVLVYPIIVLRSAAGGFIYSTMGALTAKRVQPHEQGELMGVSASLNSLMAIISPLIAGVLFDQVLRVAPYWTAVVLFVSAAYLLKVRGSAPAAQVQVAS